jgi:ComF family protein
MPPTLLKELFSGASHLLFPQLCEGCHTPLLHQERVLCMGCTYELPQTGFHHIPDNEAALRVAGRIPFKYATAFAYFSEEGLMQHLMHRLKYSGRKSIGKFLGQQAGYALKSVPWITEIDAIVPVPLHPRKHAKRGYNQSAIIAEGIGQSLNIPVESAGLIRIKNTDSQTKKSREQRLENVKGAFALNAKKPITAKHVLLVDDVLTTGATIEAAASALLVAPGFSLSICTIGLAS